MSADILRRAAALMRERAEAAIAYEGIGESWAARPSFRGADNHGWTVYLLPEAEGFDDAIADLSYDYEGAVSKHVASWHPAVALAVADWLDRVIRDADDDNYEPQEFDSALSVARAYLGETP